MNDKTPTQSDFTAEESEITFNPSKEKEEVTNEKVKNVKKRKKAKWYFLIPAILLIIFIMFFVGWYIKPKTQLNVAVLDKTILTVEEGNDIDIDSVYRKHQGLFWLLKQQRYVFEDNSFYENETDYFGPILNNDGQIESERELSDLDYTPDLMYISDVYGAVDDTYGYYDSSTAKGAGVTVDDMSVISYSHEIGSTIVAEMELFNSNLDSTIYSQLSSLLGVKPTGWVGRYVYDLQDFTDVPDWAPPMYEKQEGVEWQFSGPGIILVSDEKIIILEQKSDFESKNLLQIHINEDYKKEFRGCEKVNFYNWFEIVEPVGDSEVIASFEFDVNATGMEKLKGVLKSPKFAAISRKTTEGKAPIYYFAGDFNDYVSKENYNGFLFADRVYRWLAYDRQGDISNFFWNFYNPLTVKILSDITPLEKSAGKTDDNASFKIRDGKFYKVTEKLQDAIKLNTVSINATEPGESEFSRNYSFYEGLVAEAAKLNANCILAKDILPPEFYRAVFAHNSNTENSPIYIIQNIDKGKKTSDEQWQTKLKTAVDILHGNGSYTLSADDEKASKYFIDVSPYVVAVTVDTKDGTRNYKGTFASGNAQSGFAAFSYDTVQSYEKEKYGDLIPIGICTSAKSVKGTGYDTKTAYTLDSIITDNECLENYAFTSVSFSEIKGLSKSKTPNYNKIFTSFNTATGNKLFITDIGFSSTCGMGKITATTESEQGKQTVDILSVADKVGILCGAVADLNDDWSAVSNEMHAFTVPSENNSMWHNVADPAQTTGLVALDSVTPETSGINLADDDRVQMLSLSANEGYLYITAQFLGEIDYKAEQLFIGIDTYQRNDGEYYYSKSYTPTSLSGLEYVIRFDSKQKAGLYVIPSYNRSSGSAVTKESYSGEYELVSKFTYGGFSSGDNQFYQTGSTVYIRIPWTWLNVTDPSQKIVINNSGKISGQAKTTSTNGAVVSVMIADKKTKDQLYLFPESKQDPSYKTFKWASWETVNYTMREKESFVTVAKYFDSVKTAS